MKTRFDIISLILVFLAAGCVRNEYSEELTVKEKMVFAAYTEGEDETKTTLDGEVGSSARKVMWDIDDAIGIVAEENSTFEKFINTQTDPSAKGLFEGTIRNSENYYAIYPYDETFKKSGSVINFSLPSVQIYKENSFGTDCSPMVAKKSTGEDLKFKNLCGVLVLRMTGDFSVKSITFMAKDENGNYMKVSGGASVDMAYVRTPEMVMADDAYTSVELDCGDGVQLSASESTPFHIVLPVGVYSTFELVVTSTDGDILTKEGLKPLTISRSMATKTGDFTPEEVAYIDLSLRGTANCYVVSEKGYYSIDVSVIGNGEAGIIADSGFHTEDPSISPDAADVLWDDVPGDIYSVTLDKVAKKIRFATHGNEGNALLAVKDANNEILWSWHIWKTDVPVEQQYVNSVGTFYVQDRNLGATRSDRGQDDEIAESYGLNFLPGRKDPFHNNFTESSSEKIDVLYSIKNPQVKGNWEPEPGFWSLDLKTIYDPCPVGYVLCTVDVWSDFSIRRVKGSYDNGWNFYIDSENTETSWYPIVDHTWRRTFMHARGGSFGYFHYTESSLGTNASSGNFWPLRCMKDDDFSDASIPTITLGEVENISSISATVVGNLMHVGKGQVEEMGVILGTSSDISIEEGTIYKQEVKLGEFRFNLSGLNSFTKYYIRGYAINEYGVSYTPVQVFMTEYDGDVANLSQDGTANCYVVSQPGAYCFDASIIGNGETGIISDAGFHTTTSSIDPASAELLWEDKIGLISNTSYDPVNKAITFLTDETEGNAVIVAKNEEGAIIWSWHIWCTDQPQEITFNSEVLMDRNIGAITAKVSNEDEAGMATGLFYQWGRKDPFDYNLDVWSKGDTFSSIEESINNPTVYSPGDAWLGADNNKLWGGKKTIYDPCPAGWRVVNYSTWTYFSTEECDDYGAYLTGEEGNRYWFPYHDRTDNSGNYQIMGKRGELWTNQCRGTISYTGSNFSYYDRCTSDSYPVRCQKIE